MTKHAPPGAHCSIMVDMDSTGVEAVFSNPRSASSSRKAVGGLGLIGATERVQALGGELQTLASDDQWVLTVAIPSGTRTKADDD